MLCLMCGVAPATVHLTKVFGGKVIKVDLCQACASKLGLNPGEDIAIGAVLESIAKILGKQGLEDIAKLKTKQEKKSKVTLRCPECGWTDEDFSKNGRLGCSQCYEVFKKKIAEAIEQMHRGCEHVGKKAKAPTAGEGTVRKKTSKKTSAKKSGAKKAIEADEGSELLKKIKHFAPADSLSDYTDSEIEEEIKSQLPNKGKYVFRDPSRALIVMREMQKRDSELIKKAIVKEDYEQAAKLRDEINLLGDCIAAVATPKSSEEANLSPEE